MTCRTDRLGVLVALLATLISSTLGLACSRKTDKVRSQPRDQLLVIGTRADLVGVNELTSRSGFNHEILSNLFPRLLTEMPDFQAHPPTLAPALAESYTWSEDHLELVFSLRQDLSWSDGNPITAFDVVWTWEAQTHPEVGWGYAFVKDHILSVTALDTYRVRFLFDQVYSAQLLDANEGLVLPSKAWSALPFEDWRDQPEWFQEHLVVSGPFTLESWEPRQQLVLRRIDEAALAQAPDRIYFRVLPEINARLAQLKSGDAQFVDSIRPAEAKQLDEIPGVEAVRVPTRQYAFLAWNTTRPLFSEARIRQALTQAIDRQGLTDALYHGFAQVASSPIPSSVWAHNGTIAPWPFDPRAAEEILEEAGWRDTDGDGIRDRDGIPFSFELSTNSGNPTREDALVMIQEMLRKVGVEALPRLLDIQSLIALNESHDFDATLGAWAIDTSLDVRYAFHSDEIDGGSNYGGYSEPEVDRLIEEIRASTDLEQSLPLLHRLQEVLHRDQPYTFLWEPDRLHAMSSRLTGAQPSALGTFFGLHTWRLEPGEE